MASKVPYYYSDLKKGAIPEAEKNNLNKVENPYEKGGRGFDNPLLAIEPDITTCDVPEKASTFQKKKKKKKSLATHVYRRSNSLMSNSAQMSSSSSNYARKGEASSENATCVPRKEGDLSSSKRRSSEPNIYEEIPELPQEEASCYSGSIQGFPPAICSQNKKCDVDRTSVYSSKLVLDEVEKVQQTHAKIIEKLNLDVEAMIMPEDTACSEELRSEREMGKLCSDHHMNPETKASHILSPGTPPLYFASARWQGSCSTLPKPETASLGRRIMNEYILQQSDFGPSGKGSILHGQRAATLCGKVKASQRSNGSTYAGKPLEDPLYMLYDDTHRKQSLSRAAVGHLTPEDNIYEEVDLQQLYRTSDFGDTLSWGESELALDHSHSSGSEENEDDLGNAKVAARFIDKKDKNSRKHRDTEGFAGRFTRWLSTRKKEYELENGVHKINRHSQVLCTDEEGYVDVKIPKKKRPPLSLPPMPASLSQEKLKRRLIVGSIVESENSYVNSLHQLITDYKFPLENSNPPILSANKISKMFLHLENILQCHKFFGIALTQCVRQWDQEEKIGEVFVDSFSKAIVLDKYSEFINNFSVAMETAKQASKNKSAFADFLKVKQINSSNRLSFFGLMVKPVQRIPQFILLLQDLLKHTPHGHHDRMALQQAMTQLGSLAETLNERKKEAEQHHAVKEILKHLGKFSLKSFTDRDHYLLRQDDVVRFQFDHSGLVIKSKKRRLFLLNDLLVAVSVTPRSTDSLQNGERLNSKWAVPLQEVEVQEDISPATRNLIASSGKQRNSGTRNTERHIGGGEVQTLYDELSDLVHDLEVISRLNALVSSLRCSYSGLNSEILQGISHSIQEQIRQKDEEITILDSCCLQLLVPLKSKSSKESVCFQMKSPAVKREWITELRMAKLALDPNNTPAWHVPDQEKRPSSKMPLFVNAFCPYPTSSSSEVKCGCHYTVYTTSLPQQYLWMCLSDGVNSHLVVMCVHFNEPRVVAVYYLNETRVLSMDSAPNILKECINTDEGSAEEVKHTRTVETVWIGTIDNKNEMKLLVLDGSCPKNWEEVGSTTLPAAAVQIKHYWDQVFVALDNGSIAVFHVEPESGQWQLQNPSIIAIDQIPITCLLPIGTGMHCACGPNIWVVDVMTHEVQQNYPVQHDDIDQAFLLAHSGAGLWVALKDSSKICLYHTETFRHIHHIDISDNVNSILSSKDKPLHEICITSLVASKGLLWVGTNVGILLTVPLPRLEGVPLTTGCISLAFHAHQGPVTLLLSLQPKPISHPHLPSPAHRRPASADGNNEALDTGSRSRVVKQVSDSVLPSHASSSKRNSGSLSHNVGDVHASGAKTLPRGMTFCQHVSPLDMEDSNDVYGLYADLMNVQDYEKDSQEKLHERLNHSDPELVNFHLNTLDRRVQQKSGRPRSWDLSAMAVSEDSDSSAAYETSSTATATSAATEIGAASSDSTSAENSASPLHQPHKKSPVSATQVSLGRTLHKSAKSSALDSSPKTLLMLTGGCGYINWRKPDRDGKQNLEPHAMIWEVKL